MDRSHFRTPLTDLFCNIVSHQYGGPCQKFEMDLIDCMEVYGLPRSQEKCKNLYLDFQECSSRTKQDGRVQAMIIERHKQYFKGERSKADRYAETPTFDSFDNQPVNKS